MNRGRVERPEWLGDAMPRVESVFRLYRDGRLPKSIEAWMVAVPLKHALRSVYGKSNLGTAWAMFREALSERIQQKYWNLRYSLGFGEKLADEEEDECL